LFFWKLLALRLFFVILFEVNMMIFVQDFISIYLK
jgi:hypothetical protein